MDQKCVKKMKKRKDLDKLIGNGRKHIRKKSGHILLKTDSQSSISSEEVDQVSSIHYRRSRCSSFLAYANLCLSTSLLIVCSVLIVLVLVMRANLTSLQNEVHAAYGNDAQKSHDLHEMYNRLQSLQIHIGHLTTNLTKNAEFFRATSQKVSRLEKDIRHLRGFEALLGSLHNVPAQLSEIQAKSNAWSKVMRDLQKKVLTAGQRIQKLSTELSGSEHREATAKADEGESVKQPAPDNSPEKRFAEPSKSAKRSPFNGTFVSREEYRDLQERMSLFETLLNTVDKQLARLTSNSTESHGRQVNTLAEQRSLLSQKSASFRSVLGSSANSTMNKIISDVRILNSSLQNLLENLPGVRLTLGYGVENATLPSEPLGKGVILRRGEYFKLRKFWTKASEAFVVSSHARQRVDVLEKEFSALRMQVLASIKNARALEASGSGEPATPPPTANISSSKNVSTAESLEIKSSSNSTAAHDKNEPTGDQGRREAIRDKEDHSETKREPVTSSKQTPTHAGQVEKAKSGPPAASHLASNAKPAKPSPSNGGASAKPVV